MKRFWIILTSFKRDSNNYFLDVSDFDISDEEIQLNIIAQIYEEFFKTKKKENIDFPNILK